MSAIDTILQRLSRMLDDRFVARDPFRGIVASVPSTGMVTVRRLEAATAESEPRARIAGGVVLAVNDEVLCLPVNGKPVVIGKVQRTAGLARHDQTFTAELGADQTTTSNLAQAVSGFLFSVGANETWALRCRFYTGTTNSAGIKFAWTNPVGASGWLGVEGSSTAVTAIVHVPQSAQGTLTPTPVHNGAFTWGWANVEVTVEVGANPGNIGIQFASAVSGETARLRRFSHLTAWRVA